MADKDRNLIEELERRLCWYRDEATDEEFDAEEVDAICVMLQKLSPVKEPHRTKEEAYQNIMERIRKEDEEENGSSVEKNNITEKACKKNKGTKKNNEKKKGRFGRISLHGKKGYCAAILFIIVFGAAVLSLNMETYARGDKSLFTMILEKVGVLKIVKEETPEEYIVKGNDEIKTFYDSWTELDKEVKSKLTVPKYIPEDFELYGLYYYNLDNREKIKADYYNNKNGHLVFSITLWEEGNKPYREIAIDEKSYKLLTEYSDENKLLYEYKDEYICMISRNNSFYRISGNITLDEMKKVQEGVDVIR